MKKWVLGLILLLGGILRLVALEKYPVGFTPDEASFGYDAYSILKTGADQWGHKFPLVLESFGDFKSPLYGYLSIPSVAAFGLTKLATRLPNAILGTLAIWVVYLLAKEIFKKESIGLAAALLLAILPWHVQLSRGAFEANLTTFFLPLGVYLFWKKKYALSGLVLGLDLLSYHSAKVVTPLVLAGLVFFLRKEIDWKAKSFFVGAMVFLIFLVGAGYAHFRGGGARAYERSITQGALQEAFAERTRSSSLFHNKYVVVSERFFRNYLTYFSPQFLFTEGAREGTYGMIPGRGVLFWFFIPFFIALRKVFFTGKYRRELSFLLVWVLLAPIPAALATGVGYHANRVTGLIPALVVMLAVGTVEFMAWLKAKKIWLTAFILLSALFFVFFLEDYFIQSPYKIAQPMLYGNLEMAYWLKENTGEGEVVVARTLSEPQIYVAFAERWDPTQYQKATKDWQYETWVDQIPSYKLGKYTFKNEKVNVGRPQDFLITPRTDKEINYPDGTPALYAQID